MSKAHFRYNVLTGWWVADFCKLSKLMMPTFMRSTLLNAWICAMTKPLQRIHGDFLRARRDDWYSLEHNSQVCYLRKLINDRFDKFLRRIIITDGLGLNALYIYTEGENFPKYIYTEAENNPLYIHNASAFADTGVDFYVIVPLGLNFNETKMRALIDAYRLAGKRYEIISS